MGSHKIVRINKKKQTVSVDINWVDRVGITRIILYAYNTNELYKDVAKYLINGGNINGYLPGYADAKVTTIIDDMYQYNQVKVLSHA
jgi:hypothetical protein